MSSSEIYPPRARRYVDNQLVLSPRYYPDPGPEGFYPELQHPVQTRLGIRFNTVLNKEVYVQLNAVFMAGMRMGITQNEIREYFRGISDNFIFTEFHKHPQKDFMITCMEFGSAKDADDVICFARDHKHLLGGDRVAVRYSDILGSITDSTRNVLLVREELALSPPYSPRSLMSASRPPLDINARGWSHHPYTGPHLSLPNPNQTQQQNIQLPYPSTPNIPSRSNGTSKAYSPSIPVPVDPFTRSSSSTSKRGSHSQLPGSFPRDSPMVPSPINRTFTDPATRTSWDNPFTPIPTGPRPLVERIAFSPNPKDPIVPPTVTPVIGTPINKISPDELTKALQRLTEISYKLNFQVDPSPGKVPDKLQFPPPPVEEKKGKHPYSYGLASWSKRYERSHRGMIDWVKRGRYFGKYQTEEMDPENRSANEVEIKHEDEDRKRSTSSFASYKDTSSRGRSSSSSYTNEPYNRKYGGREGKGNGYPSPDNERVRRDRSHHQHRRHGHGNHDHKRPRNHQDRHRDGKERTEDRLSMSDLKGFEHHFHTPSPTFGKTVEPKYVGISEDGACLVFGSKRRDVELALNFPEASQTPTDTDSSRGEAARGVADDGRGGVPSHDHEKEVEEVKEIEDDEWRMKSKRKEQEGGCQEISRERGIEVVEEGEIIEEIKANGLKEDKDMVVEPKEDLNPEVDINVFTGDSMNGDATGKTDTPTSHRNESLPQKPSSEATVFRVSDLSSDILSLLGIELRYTFRNTRLNEVDRWDDISGSEGNGKVLTLDLPNQAQALTLGLDSSAIEIEGILQDGNEDDPSGEGEEVVGIYRRGTRRFRSGSGEDHLSEEEGGRTKRRRRKII